MKTLNIGPSKITISTVGVVPGILRLAEEERAYKLAVSLHGTTDAERSALVPVVATPMKLGEQAEPAPARND